MTVVKPMGYEAGALLLTVGVVSITSLTVGVPKVMGWLIPTTTLAGQVKVGAVVSRTVILKLQVLRLGPSLAVQLTVEEPSGKVEPEVASQLTLGVVQASEAVGVAKDTLTPATLVASTVCDPGQVMLGAIVSTTLMLKEQLAVFRVSVALQRTEVLPKGKPEPEGGKQPVLRERPQLSGSGWGVAKVTVAREFTHSAVIGAGQLSGGGIVSRTVTVPVQVLWMLWESVTVRVTLVVPKP